MLNVRYDTETGKVGFVTSGDILPIEGHEVISVLELPSYQSDREWLYLRNGIIVAEQIPGWVYVEPEPTVEELKQAVRNYGGVI